MDPNLAAMLFQFLPPLYLICINYLLLMSLYSAARIEPHFTETGKMLSTLKKSFAYLLFSSLLLPCLGVASVTVLVHHVFNNSTDRYHAFIDAVSSFFVTACGEFFVNYVCQRTWVSPSFSLYFAVCVRVVHHKRCRAPSIASHLCLDSPFLLSFHPLGVAFFSF